MNTSSRLTNSLLALVAVGAGACDYSGDFLFPSSSPQAPSLYELRAQDGGPLVPADIATADDLAANIIYGEVGAPTSSAAGGVTFTFNGTGSDVCVYVDPEAIYWTESIDPRQDSDTRPWSFPDNVFDDGDIDLSGGLSVYYTGSADEIGDFKVQYTDPLGNPVAVSLSVCQQTGSALGFDEPNAHSGRGTPEYCTMSNTELGASYTVVMETFSTPLDDDRLAYGLILANGDCDTMIAQFGGASNNEAEECIIPNEAIAPGSEGPWYGETAIDGLTKSSAGGSYNEFETTYCTNAPLAGSSRLDQWCQDELDATLAAGQHCDYNGTGDSGDATCFCGNPDDSPQAGPG